MTTKDISIKCPNNFYVILSSYVEEYVKKNWGLNFMYLVGFQVSKFWKFFWKTYRGASLEIIFRFHETPFFIFLTVLHMVWKNQESCESWLVGFCLVGIQKCKKFLPTFFLLHFWAAINDLLITLKCQFLLFLMSYLEEFQPVKYYFSRISTSRNIKL